mgnify:CR=1 FL=1
MAVTAFSAFVTVALVCSAMLAVMMSANCIRIKQQSTGDQFRYFGIGISVDARIQLDACLCQGSSGSSANTAANQRVHVLGG